VRAESKPGTPNKPTYRNISMQTTVTLILLLASLFVILSDQYDPNSQHWAFATVGTILGYWLKGGRG
jgi:uncharacterized membrane protein